MATDVWVFPPGLGEWQQRGTVYADDCLTYMTVGHDIHFDPANPAASGYTLMFDDEFTSASTVDANHTGATGYNWYVGQYFGDTATPLSMFSVSGGVLSIPEFAG